MSAGHVQVEGDQQRSCPAFDNRASRGRAAEGHLPYWNDSQSYSATSVNPAIPSDHQRKGREINAQQTGIEQASLLISAEVAKRYDRIRSRVTHFQKKLSTGVNEDG